MKRNLILFFLLILALNVFAVDSNVVSEIQNNGNADVVVLLDEGVSIENFQYDEKLEDINGFVINVNLNELSEIISNPGVNDIDLNIPFSISLTESVPMIGASAVQNFGHYGTGSVCLLDTGVDYTHSLLGACSNDTFLEGNCEKIVGGYDFINDDNDPMDDQGHGTHVAGIIAANGSLVGVAPSGKIVAVKVLDSFGNGNESQILQGLNYCIENAVNYNIKVISMSFTTNQSYETSCDNVLSSLTEKIDEAIEKNITVVASSGNHGSSTGLALPSCISNVTSVGAVDKSDNIASFSNRNQMLSLLAPGVSIRSSALGGGEIIKSGTSMAAPEVSGALLLMETMLIPQDLVGLLRTNGVQVFDESSNLTYPRLNIYNALVSMDEIPPLLTLIKPENKTYFGAVPLEYSVDEFSPYEVYYYLNGEKVISNNNNTSLNLIVGSYDFVLCANQTNNNLEDCKGMNFSVARLDLVSPVNGNQYLNGNISLQYSVSSSIASCWYSLDNGQNNVTLNDCFESSFIASEGNNNLIFYVRSSDNVESSQSVSFVYQPVKPVVTLGAPEDNGWVKSDGNLNCSAQDDNLLNLILYVDGSLVSNVSTSSLTQSVNVAQGVNHTWNCYAIDGDGFEDWSDNNRTFAVDNSVPKITITSHVNNDVVRGASFSLRYNITEETVGISSCKLYSNDVEKASGGISLISENSVTVETPSDGDYNLNVKCIDLVGNIGSSLTVKIKKVTEATPENDQTPVKSAGGNGGSSGDSDEESDSTDEAKSEDVVATEEGSVLTNSNLVQYREEGSQVIETGIDFSGFYLSSLEDEEESSGITGFFVQGYDAVFGKKEENETTVEFNFTNNGESDLENFVVYSEVPKTFSEDASEMEVNSEGARMEVVEQDPVFKFIYDKVAKGETKVVGYTVQKTVDTVVLSDFIKPDFVIEAVKSGKSYLGWYLLISIGVLVLILVLFLGKNFDKIGEKFFNFKYAVKDKVSDVKQEVIVKTKYMPKVQKVVSKIESEYDEELPDTLAGKKFE